MRLENAFKKALNYIDQNIKFEHRDCDYSTIRKLLQELQSSVTLQKPDKVTLRSIRKCNVHDIMINDSALSKLISDVTYEYDMYFNLIDPDLADIMNGKL
jgi:hypothetical protein